MSSTSTTPIRTRDNSQIVEMRSNSPYINFYSGSPKAQDHPITSPLRARQSQSQTSQASNASLNLASSSHAHPYRPTATWTTITETGHGSRHAFDKFPFSFWVKDRHDYRAPSDEEMKQISQTYNTAQGIEFGTSFIIIITDSPPKDVPLTIGCVPAYFISSATHKAGWSPQIPFGHSGYSNPRAENPYPECIRRPWQHPTAQDIEIIANRLIDICNVQHLIFSFPYLTVVIRSDGRIYKGHSLPGRVGSWATTYHHSETRLWNQFPLARDSRDREMTPNVNTGIQDMTDYLRPDYFLSPGVRLVGETKATTCGIQVTNKAGARRITCANHGFLDTNQVFHPNNDDIHIGIIKERYEEEDVALFEPNSQIKQFAFRNNTYFAAPNPKRLLTGDELLRLKGTWFQADGMSTGIVSLLNDSVIVSIPPRPEGAKEIRYAKFIVEFGFNVVGTVGHYKLADGICGAPIVQCDEDSKGEGVGMVGGVAGFFQNYVGGGICTAPVLDRLINDGWELV
jgi:hypothetical protein